MLSGKSITEALIHLTVISRCVLQLSIVNILQQLGFHQLLVSDVWLWWDKASDPVLIWSKWNLFFFYFLYINKKIDGKTEKKTIGDYKWNRCKQNLCSCYFDTHLFLASYCLKTLLRELHSREKKKLCDRKPWQWHSVTDWSSHFFMWKEKEAVGRVGSAVVPVFMLWK